VNQGWPLLALTVILIFSAGGLCGYLFAVWRFRPERQVRPPSALRDGVEFQPSRPQPHPPPSREIPAREPKSKPRWKGGDTLP
jgi:hypothetical protein